MSEVEQQGRAAEREVRESHQRRLQQASELLRQQAQEDLRAALRLHADHLAADLERERLEHTQETSRLQAQADREHAQLLQTLSERSSALKSRFHREMKEQQEGCHKRLLDLKTSHLLAMDSARREHEQQVPSSSFFFFPFFPSSPHATSSLNS